MNHILEVYDLLYNKKSNGLLQFPSLQIAYGDFKYVYYQLADKFMLNGYANLWNGYVLYNLFSIDMYVLH